jgi:hypothetical protein
MNHALNTCLTLLLWPALASAQDAALRQCRALTDTSARLTCYDAIALPVPVPVPMPAPVPAAVPMPAPAAAPGPVPAPAAMPAATLEAQFGLPSAVDRVERIVTRFEGRFEGWRAKERIRLANGQVWQVVDDSQGVYDLQNPTVTIRRGALGRFVLDIQGAGKTPTVRRVE